MNIQHLAPGLSISDQIEPMDLAALKAAGFRAIVCNRPDGESGDQPPFSDIERAARALGLAAYYLPADAGKATEAHGVAFGHLLAQLPGPVLAYCRTGKRSNTMWVLSQSNPHSL